MPSSGMAPQLSQTSVSDETRPSLFGPLKMFYLGEPLALGITQILIGFMVLAFGIVLDISEGYYIEYVSTKTPYWTGILFVISGAFPVAASWNPKMSLVKGMLGMNVVGALGAAIGIVILSLSILFYRPSWSTSCRRRCIPEGNEMCLEYCQSISDTIYGMQCILLAFNILEFCIAISASVFGCRTVCRDSYADTIVVIYQNVTPDKTVSQVAPEVL